MSKRAVTNRQNAAALNADAADAVENDSTDVDANVDTGAEVVDTPTTEAPAAGATEAQALAVKAETARCSGLHSLAAQASRLGVKFDAAKAIETGLSLETARTRVLNAAAEVDDIETSAVVTPRGGNAAKAGSITAEAKAAAWKKAMKR